MKLKRESKSLIIKGIKKSEYPLLYESIENVMTAFDMDNICVEVKEGSLSGKRINADAGWTITLNKKLIPTYCDKLRVTREMLNEMTKDELEAVIAHEFSHFFNRDNIFDLIIEKPFSISFFALFMLIPINIYFQSFNLTMLCILLILFFSMLFHLLLFLLAGFWLNSSWSQISSWMLTLHEIRSDIEAVSRTKKPEGMKNALRKLENLNKVKKNSVNEEKPSIFVLLKQKIKRIMKYRPPRDIHPPKKKRLEYVDYTTKVKIRGTENPKRLNTFSVLNNIWKEFSAYKIRSNYLLTKKEFESLSDLAIYIGLTF